MVESIGTLGTNRFVAATEQLDDGTTVVSVMGEVDRATAPALERTLVAVAEEPTGAVIVDFTRCRFLDSTGLRILVETKGRLEESNRRLALVVSNSIVMRIFKITRFDDLFEIHLSLAAAVDDERP
ncbi:MAG TPA: STAS domain-containing protein [Thermoleophilaceae bacterium]